MNNAAARFVVFLIASSAVFTAPHTFAALLAYEPFTNAPGTAIIGSGGGYNFSGAWLANNSSGVATNTDYALSYTDTNGNSLVTDGGAAFFQGLTTANSSMQPVRLFNFSRGTNGLDGVTTWLSFLIKRQGPTNGDNSNPYGRGCNVGLDLNGSASSGVNQKLAFGNSSGAITNTVGLIPYGQAGNLRSSTIQFGPLTNFVVLRIDHVPGGNDNAWLFVNPPLDSEPSTNSASASALGAFDFSFDRCRPFTGGHNPGAQQPYGEMIVDEYRIGETFADVTPHTRTEIPEFGPVIITDTAIAGGDIVLSGIGGYSNGTYFVVASTNHLLPVTNWPAIATNQFAATGSFQCTVPMPAEFEGGYFRVLVGTPPPPPPQKPFITTNPADQSAGTGQTVSFSVVAGGTAPLNYQWFFNTNTPLAGTTSATLTLTNAQTNQSGGYSVIVSNFVGSVTSEVAVLTVTNLLSPPSITSQPADQAVVQGSNALFSVAAIGPAPLSYQWWFNTNTPLADATNASLTLTNVQTNQAGVYSVLVSNDFGSTNSLFATLTVNPPLLPGAFFVSFTNGNDSNPGTEASPFKTISRGLTAIASGGVVYVRAGSYPHSSRLTLSGTGGSPANMKRLWGYPGEFPIIDSTGNSGDGVGISGRNYHLKGLTVMKAGHNGINISGSSNIVEFCTVRDNGNTGLHLTGSSSPGPSYNLILNCDAFLNYDPPDGGDADGFSAKWTIGPGNVFRGCRAWWNSDDGWDLWMGTSPVLIDNCWAFYNGTNYWNDPQFNGNGQGFKIGGNYIGTPHRLVRSLAFKNESNGVDQNNNIAGQTIDNNTSWGNRTRNFHLNHGTNTTPHVVRNNLSFSGGSSDSFRSGTIFTNNSWQVISSPAANASDVQSVSDAGVTGPRQADGSLPNLPFLRPVPGGRLIDKGVDVGDPFAGAAPDLGAYEIGL